MRPIPAPRLGDAHGLLRAIGERERLRLDEFVTEFTIEELFPPGLENALGRTRQFVSFARAAGLLNEDRGTVELTDMGKRYVRAADASKPFDVGPAQAEWLRRLLRERHMTDSIFHGTAVGLSLYASNPADFRASMLDFGRALNYLGRAGWDNDNTFESQGERYTRFLADLELIDGERRLTAIGQQTRDELTLPIHMSLKDIAAQLNPGGLDAAVREGEAEWSAAAAPPPAPVAETPAPVAGAPAAEPAPAVVDEDEYEDVGPGAGPLDYTDDGFSDPVNRGRLRDAFLDAARAAHGSGGLPRSDAFRPPDALEPEEQRVFEHAARWYLALYGDRPVTLHLHDCDRPTERGGIRVGGWVDLTVEHEDGTKELRQIDLWRSRAPREDPMELESVWMAVLRLRPWVGDGSLVVSWADLVGGARCERVVQLGDELEPLRERFETRLTVLRTRADPLRPIPGGGCARCNHLVRCPAHPGALPVRTPRGDSKPGVFRLTPTSFDTWTRCRRDWWLGMLSVPASDDTGFPDHGQLLHDILRLVHEQGSCHDAAHLADVLDSHSASDRLRDEVSRHVERCPSPAEALGHELDMAQFFAARPALHSFLVTARLDAVWQHGDVLDARDYKTGRVRTARVADDARAWIQVLSLTGIAQARGLRIRLRYEHLAAEIDEEPEPWEPDAEELEGLEARIRAAVVEMRDEHDFSGVADAQVCGWCRYRSICRDSAAPGEAQWPEILPDEPAPAEALNTAAR